MMYLSRLTLNQSRKAVNWLNNSYRIHQRLKMACDQDPRLLFRVEETDGIIQILVQSQNQPKWSLAFADLDVLLGQPEMKQFSIQIQEGRQYRFRILANPTIKKTLPTHEDGKHKLRVGLLQERDQRAWLERKLSASGAEAITYMIIPKGSQRSHKSEQDNLGNTSQSNQTHFAVLFEGVLRVIEPYLLEKAIKDGIGSAKGYGFGLLSLA